MIQPAAWPVIVRRADLFDKTRLPDWAFGTILLHDDQIAVHGEGSRWTLEINPDSSSLGVFNSRGRDYLRQMAVNRIALASGTDAVLRQNSSETEVDSHQTLLHRPANGSLLRPKPGTIWRWSSGGVLPIVRWRGKRWVAFSWRSRPGIGLSLLCGCSEKEEELFQQKILSWREFGEEFVVIEQDVDECLRQRVGSELGSIDRLTRAPLYWPGEPPAAQIRDWLESVLFKEDHAKLRKEQDRLNFEKGKNKRVVKPIEIPSDPTGVGYEIKVVSSRTESEGWNPENFLFQIDQFNCAIDCIWPLEIDLRDSDYLLQGEIWEGGTGSERETLVRDPMILISLERLQKALSPDCPISELPTLVAAGQFVNGDEQTSYSGKTLQYCCAEDIHVFEADLKLRRQRLDIIQKHLDNPRFEREYRTFSRRAQRFETAFRTLSERLKKFGGTTTNLVDQSVAPLVTLCPISWKCLELLFASGYRLKG